MLRERKGEGHTVVNGSEHCTVLSVDQLCNQQRRRPMGDGDAEPDKEATCQKHSEVETDAPQDNS